MTGVLIPEGVHGDAVRAMMLDDFGIEIGTSFGPLAGRIWRIGTMGYTCRKRSVLLCLMALGDGAALPGLPCSAGRGGGRSPASVGGGVDARPGAPDGCTRFGDGA